MEEDFEMRLMNKYPSLFSKNELGELECPCGIWVPQGWEKTVDSLCGAIVDYTTLTYRQGQEILSKKYYLWHVPHFLFKKIHYKIINLFPKLNGYELNKPFYNFLHKLSANALKHAKWIKIYPPAVKIEQIKEKYASLRFYYTGGDKQVEGMVHMAEYLCSKTCEASGEEGALCIRGGWLRTLSPKLLEQEPYKGYKIAKQK